MTEIKYFGHLHWKAFIMLTYRHVSIFFGLLNLMIKAESKTRNVLKQTEVPNFQNPPSCGDALTFCEDVDSYPYEYIKDVLDKHPIYKSIFGNSEQQDQFIERYVDHRNYLCKSLSRVIYPKIGRNTKNEWKYIINDDTFRQSVHVDLCRRLGSPCDVVGDAPKDVTATCEQKYIHSSLLSINDEGIPYTETFQIPSACCCSFKKQYFFGNEI